MAQVDAATIGVGDFYTLRSDPSIKGILLQTWYDVDGGPIVLENRVLVRKGLPDTLSQQIKRTKLVPKDYLVLKTLPTKVELLVHKNDLVLLDRYFSRGDVVKRSPTDAQSGTVIGTACSCALRPSITFTRETPGDPISYHVLAEDTQITCVDSHMLQSSLPWNIGDTVLYEGWIGTIEETILEVGVRLMDGSTVVIEDSEDVKEIVPRIPADFAYERLVGKSGRKKRISLTTATPCHLNQMVRVNKRALLKGRWIEGAYNSALQPNGIIRMINCTQAEVRWKMARASGPQAEASIKPSAVLQRRVLESGAVTHYDYSRGPKAVDCCEDPFSAVNDMIPGEYALLQDNLAAGSRNADPGTGDEPQAEQPMASSSQTWVVAEITSTASRVKIQWQDNTITEEMSSSICPYSEVDDYDVWPGEIVSLKGPETVLHDLEYEKMLRTRAVGVVQSVDAVERIAKIRWYRGVDITITGEDNEVLVRPHSKFGKITKEITEVSLYELGSYQALTKRRGDLVSLQRPDDIVGQSGMAWIGEVVDLLPNGLLLVRLGALGQVRDIKCSVLDVIVVFSADDSTIDSDSQGTMDSDEWEDDEMIPEQQPITMSVEYEGSVPSESPSNEEDQWETDSNDVAISDDETSDDSNGGQEADTEMVDTSSSGREDDIVADIMADIVDAFGKHSTLPLPELSPKAIDDIFNTEWPESLKAYAMRSLRPANRLLGIERSETLKRLGMLITQSVLTKTLLTVDWEDLPLPQVMIREERSGLRAEESTMEENRSGDEDLARPVSFEVLEGSAPKHTFPTGTGNHSKDWLRAVSREHRIMRSSLPEGVYVRTWESNMELVRVLLVGPSGTPYAHAPYLFDLHLHDGFPLEAPKAFFHSWTNGIGRINPNLYEDGKVCLSLLGTWSGDESDEEWVTGKSTVLQIIVSLLGLVLVQEPYYSRSPVLFLPIHHQST